MKWFQTLLLVAGVWLGNMPAQAQVKDPTTWSYEVKKSGNGRYELVFVAQFADSWHIYSMNPGGDGTLLPPVFTFKAPGNVKLLGKVKESGKKITEAVEGIDGKVHYYKGDVRYVQEIQVTGSARITGEHQYQVCSDEMCLPPKTKPFTFDIKP